MPSRRVRLLERDCLSTILEEKLTLSLSWFSAMNLKRKIVNHLSVVGIFMRLKIQRHSLAIDFLAFILALALLFTIRPYFTWGNEASWGRASVLLIALVVMGVFVLGLYKKKVGLFAILFSFFFMLFIVTTEMPVRAFDRVSSLGTLVIALVPVLLFFLKDEFSRSLYKFIYFFFVIICVFSLANLLLYSFSLVSPFKNVFLEAASFYVSGFDYYSFAPVLASQYIDIGFKFYRNNGWFYEPGHFACYLAFVLAIQDKPFKGAGNLVILITMLSTLSGAAFLLIGIIYAIHHNVKVRTFVLAFLVFFGLLFLYGYSNDFSLLVGEYVFSKFVGAETLSNRQNFHGLRLSEVPISKFVFGYGGEYINVNGWQVSDFTHHIYAYGFISFLCFVAFMVGTAIVFSRNTKKALFVFIVVFMAVYAHRHFISLRAFSLCFICIAYVFSASNRRTAANLLMDRKEDNKIKVEQERCCNPEMGARHQTLDNQT